LFENKLPNPDAMKKVFLLVLLLAFTIGLKAQLFDNKWDFGMAAGSYGTTNIQGTGFLPELYFNRYVSSRFDLMLKGNMGVFNSRLINKLDFAAPFLNLKFKLSNEHNKLRPYLYAGPGFLADNNKSGLNYNIGLGTKYRISSGIALYFDCGYISGINIPDQGRKVKDNFWKATIGIEFSFKKKHETDGDGLPDKKDKCPDTPPGVPVDENGCPLDTDGDGIVDYLDNCPKMQD
jgi:OmpA-OmpF porin, OOP family